MTIGLLLDDTLDKPDGVQAAVLTIGEELRSRGHEVHYITANTSRTDTKNVHSIGTFWSFKFNGNSIRTPKPASKRRVRELFSEINFDVLHVQMPYSPLLAGRVIKLSPKTTRIIGTFHILPYSRYVAIGTKFLGVFLRNSLARIHTFIAVSAPALTFMKQSFGVDGVVVANPVNFEFFHKFKNNIQSQDIVFVGRFDERKGVMQLLKAYAALPELIQQTSKLILCGKGPLLEKAKIYAQKNGIQADFRGFVSDDEKAKTLAGAKVAVFPSTGGESFGIVLAEAMAAGAGVTLGGDNPGYRSVLADWPETIFDPNDISAFSHLLQTAISSKKFSLIGKKQHISVKAYDVKTVVDKLSKIYTA